MIIIMIYCYANDERHSDSKTMKSDSKTMNSDSKTMNSDSKTMNSDSKTMKSDSKTMNSVIWIACLYILSRRYFTQKQKLKQGQKKINRNKVKEAYTMYMYNIITYLGSMKRNFPSKLCRDANWFSFNSHSTALVKLGRARIPTPTRYRGSTEFPRVLSEVMLSSLESCVTG